MEYLALPLVLRDGYLTRTNLKESLNYSVGLILCTRIGTMPFRPDYGCDLWDKEYSDLYTSNKADIRASLRNAIARYEKRLYNASVTFSYTDKKSGPQILGMVVKVTGNYLDGNDEKKFEASYSLG